MCPLAMNPCSCDFLVTSLYIHTYVTVTIAVDLP